MSKDSKTGIVLNYEYPFFNDFVEPNGALTLDKRSHACFYYMQLAMRARHLAGDGIDSQIIQYEVGGEIPLWYKPMDVELAKSVAIIYGLESPDEFLKFKKEAWTQATHFLGLTVDLAIFDVDPSRSH